MIDSLIIPVTMGALGKSTMILNTVCMLENGYSTRWHSHLGLYSHCVLIIPRRKCLPHLISSNHQGEASLLCWPVPEQEVVRRNPGVVKKPGLTLQRPDSQHQLTLLTLTHTHISSAVILNTGCVKDWSQVSSSGMQVTDKTSPGVDACVLRGQQTEELSIFLLIHDSGRHQSVTLSL